MSIKLLIHRSTRVLRAKGQGLLHEWGLTTQQIMDLPLEFRWKLEHNTEGMDYIYHIVFDTEAEAAMFKLEYM